MVDKVSVGKVYGIVGIIFAVFSLFILPILFGPLAVISGIVAITKKEKTIGIIAIGLGVTLAIISIIIGMLFLNI